MDIKKEKRHVCILCKTKRIASKMVKTRSHWTCLSCIQAPAADLRTSFDRGNQPASHLIRVLNLYAGIGGNRKLWTGVHVTCVEIDLNVAAAYRSLYPNDTLIIGDAHQYLIKNYYKFDVIWGSYPCQTHSRMNYWTPVTKKRYPDLKMYAEIIFLTNFFKGPWVVENVAPYYAPLVPATKKIGRHLFWSNIKISDFEFTNLEDFMSLDDQGDKKKIMDWLGIHYEKNLYLSGKNYLQVFRNCVHPDIGLSIFNDIIEALKQAPPAELIK